MQEVAALEQVYGDVQESEGLLPMNELGIEFGYALYEADYCGGCGSNVGGREYSGLCLSLC